LLLGRLLGLHITGWLVAGASVRWVCGMDLGGMDSKPLLAALLIH